jgi:type IV secretory pathway VirB10-like protein
VLDRVGRQPGADTQGFAGIEDEVDYHWSRLFTTALLSTVLGVGSELGANGNDNAIVQALTHGSDTLNQTGQQVVRRNDPEHPARVAGCASSSIGIWCLRPILP